MTRHKPSNTTRQKIWLVAGWLSLALGVAGVLLPVVPASPLLGVAAVAFSRSSQRWHDWLVNRSWFGPAIRDWEKNGTVPKSAKWLATGSVISILVAMTVFLSVHWAFKVGIAVLALATLVYIWTRPSKR